MGFQFNHVGGGTKTRRPIAINMKYNAMCHDPRCYLVRGRKSLQRVSNKNADAAARAAH